MRSGIRIRLGILMFLQFFIWGSWFVTLGSFLASNLSATGSQSAMAYSTQSWGAIIAPLLVGLIADKYFNAERLLGTLHLVGALLMYALSQTRSFEAFYHYLFAYMILYMPSLALVNVISFRQLDNPSTQFSRIRVWGTLGWITAGLLISYGFSWDSAAGLADGRLKYTFTMSALASLALGLYSFTLPATPPRVKPGGIVTFRNLFGLNSLKLLTDRNFLVFFVSSILICVPLAFYYQYANLFLTEIGVAHATGKQTLGQLSETFFMLLIPFFLLRLGMKGTLLIGMLMWVIRYALFAYGNSHELAWMLLTGIALHGVCYDFFFVSGQIFTDNKSGHQYKGTAQGLITLATYGVGMLMGFWFAGEIADRFVHHGVHDWKIIWLCPAIVALGVFVLFALTFRNEKASFDARRVVT